MFESLKYSNTTFFTFPLKRCLTPIKVQTYLFPCCEHQWKILIKINLYSLSYFILKQVCDVGFVFILNYMFDVLTALPSFYSLLKFLEVS